MGSPGVAPVGLLLAPSVPEAVAGSADGTTALHRAVYAGDIEAVRRLLASGADVRAANRFGATPLQLAAVAADPSMIRELLKAGADPESPNGEGQTALMIVARTGSVEAAQLLVRAGADVNACESWGGQTALMWAAAQRQPAMVRYLLGKGARVDERATIRDWQRRVTAEGRPKDMFRGGLTPLLFAAREGSEDCASALLDAGAGIDLPDPDGVTPLILAIQNIHWDMARFLVERGADVNQWDWYGITPLYMAVDMNTLPIGKRVELPAMDRSTGIEVTRLLLDKGANVNAQLKLRPRYREVPYDRYTDPMIVWGTTSLLRASKAGDVPVIRLLLAHGANPDLANSQGVTPLMAAVGDGHIHDPTRGRIRTEDDALECYALLKAAGADVNARTIHGYADADLKIRTAGNRTALHAAASRGWNRVVKQLLADGAEVDVADSDGLTAIDYALGRFRKEFNARFPEVHADTVALLRSAGATRENPDAKFSPGTTPQITAIVPPLPY